MRPGAKSGLVAGRVYDGLGADGVAGYVWLEDGSWARCVAEGEIEPVEERP